MQLTSPLPGILSLENLSFPAANIDLAQQTSPRYPWAQHFELSLYLPTEDSHSMRDALPMSLQAAYNIDTRRWHVTEKVPAVPPLERQLTTEQLHEFIFDLDAHGDFTDDHDEVYASVNT